MESFLKYEGKKDLTFKKITEDHIYAMRRYFLQGMQEDTADHYLKIIKSVLRKAVKSNVYN